jgi:4-carboxymuconolactone decarboxylase
MIDRMPPMDPATMNEAQRKAAAELAAGPRKGVFGPFIPLLRSPDLMDRMQRVGEYLRFNNTLPAKLTELAMLITARHVTNQFEWVVHYPLAIKAGVAKEAVDAIAAGERPSNLSPEEALVHDFVRELLTMSGVSDGLYAKAVARFGEQGVVDLVGTVGYFYAVCLVMNVANTPPPKSEVALLLPLG